MFSFILGKIFRGGIARSHSNYMFNFIRNCQTVKLFSKVAFTRPEWRTSHQKSLESKDSVEEGGRRGRREGT